MCASSIEPGEKPSERFHAAGSMPLPAAFLGVIALDRFSRRPVGVWALVVNQSFGKGSRQSVPAIGSQPEPGGGCDGADPADAGDVGAVADADGASVAEPAITDVVRVKMESARRKRTCPPGPCYSVEGDTCAVIFQRK
ncbi:hypothetical protein GCM10023194_37550 [Planotetraspora phitsanulokensis]|uniref:Uncharacterized protein n=1 Tax=Planotetraspora phitsanulokensis TaxID=575192 RepID=A0A8J3XM19_9ACTN|nr:hypothetical protein Pph01_62860 [Planotetraspora phitsanulokensis]